MSLKETIESMRERGIDISEVEVYDFAKEWLEKHNSISRLEYFAARAPKCPDWFHVTCRVRPEEISLSEEKDFEEEYARDRLIKWPWAFAKMVLEAKPGQGENYKTLYFDLIYQVANKHPGETRHETAKRYIKDSEGSETASKELKARPR